MHDKQTYIVGQLVVTFMSFSQMNVKVMFHISVFSYTPAQFELVDLDLATTHFKSLRYQQSIFSAVNICQENHLRQNSCYHHFDQGCMWKNISNKCGRILNMLLHSILFSCSRLTEKLLLFTAVVWYGCSPISVPCGIRFIKMQETPSRHACGYTACILWGMSGRYNWIKKWKQKLSLVTDVQRTIDIIESVTPHHFQPFEGTWIIWWTNGKHSTRWIMTRTYKTPF